MSSLPPRRPAFHAACLSVLLVAGCGGGSHGSRASDVPDDIVAVISKPVYEKSAWGLRVVDLQSGKVIYDYNPERNFIIASGRKNFPVGLALDALGADYRFRTPVHRRGTVDAAGVLDGDLILVDLSARLRFRPTTTDQHVRIGSNTKSWTGTVILQQVQEGLLSLDDRVSKYISGVPNGDNITIEHLLTMRSGLFNYSVSREFNQRLDGEPQKIWTQDELLALAFRTPPDPPYAAPGADFLYANTNTILLASSRKSGRTASRWMRS